MKQIPAHSRSARLSGFTLIELLVVITIIAILAAVVLSAGGLVINSANRAKAANLANQIQTSCLNYYTEYSVYPVPSTATASQDYFNSDASASKTDWKQIIEALSGNISPSTGTANITGLTVSNTRAIPFITLKATDVDSNDSPLNPLSFNKSSNPYFNIGMDYDYSGIVGDTGTVPGSGIPNFASFTTGNPAYYAQPKGVTGGIIVWANCNTTTTTTSWNPNFFVRTF